MIFLSLFTKQQYLKINLQPILLKIETKIFVNMQIQTKVWSCFCGQYFDSALDLSQHFLAEHSLKKSSPLKQRKPNTSNFYYFFINDNQKVQSQKNIVMDKKFQRFLIERKNTLTIDRIVNQRYNQKMLRQQQIQQNIIMQQKSQSSQINQLQQQSNMDIQILNQDLMLANEMILHPERDISLEKQDFMQNQQINQFQFSIQIEKKFQIIQKQLQYQSNQKIILKELIELKRHKIQQLKNHITLQKRVFSAYFQLLQMLKTQKNFKKQRHPVIKINRK